MPGSLNKQFSTKEALAAALEDGGEGSNAIAGGEFEAKPVKSCSSRFWLVWGVVSGYIDLVLDIQGILNMPLEFSYSRSRLHMLWNRVHLNSYRRLV
jgi:hypothetical protein